MIYTVEVSNKSNLPVTEFNIICVNYVCDFVLSEKYAQHWCSMLSDPKGVFAACHSEISPDSYKSVSPSFRAIRCLD